MARFFNYEKVKCHNFSVQIEPNTRYIELEVNNEDESLLVVSEAWYPGWTAETDNVKVPSKMINGYIQGVHLQNSGPQNVTLEYDPLLLRQGLIASIIGLVLTLSLCFWKQGDKND